MSLIAITKIKDNYWILYYEILKNNTGFQKYNDLSVIFLGRHPEFPSEGDDKMADIGITDAVRNLVDG